MRRTLAGLLFGIAFACAGIAIAGFLLQRAAFDPDHSADSADVVLHDAKLKSSLVGTIAGGSAQQLCTTPPVNTCVQRVYRTVQIVADNPAGEKLLAGVIHDAHARLIGDQNGAVTITSGQLVEIVRDQHAAVIPDLKLDVPEVTALSIANHALDWLVPITAIAAVVFAAIGFTAHPERGGLFKGLALALLLLALLVAVLGYLIPKFVVPLLNDSEWARVPALLADDSLPLLIGLDLLLLGGAIALLAGSGMMTRRRRWSQPISTYRYSEERRWS